MKKIIILGSSGFLSQNLFLNLKDKFEITMVGRKNFNIKLDYNNKQDLIDILNNKKYDTLINCIGLADVEKCEKNKKLAFKVNVDYTKNIVEAMQSAKHSMHLIHLSTDHIYSKKGYSNEYDLTIKNNYAQTKLLSEIYASKIDSTILRTNFFGKSKHKYKKSLSDWIINSLKNKKKIYVFKDIYFNPISLLTLSKIIKIIINRKIKGIYNVGCKEGLSKSKFAYKIAKYHNLNHKLLIKENSHKLLKVSRPKDMRMNCEKFRRKFKFNLPNIDDEIINT
tara:strand:- start:220 stop:1059 length:840 start_codon:yes stop_codon:yes gene_type:complete